MFMRNELHFFVHMLSFLITGKMLAYSRFVATIAIQRFEPLIRMTKRQASKPSAMIILGCYISEIV